MQGKSKFKTNCGKFKQLGDGIQVDFITDNRFTYDFYFCNEPLDKKLLADGICPIHCCNFT